MDLEIEFNKKVRIQRENDPWVEKYRPESLSDLISHENIIKTIKRFIDENKFPNLLFYGPPGTGKTSTIKACAKYKYLDNYKSNVLELNASDERGINVVRDTIKNFASMKGITLGDKQKSFKLVILDEADAMTPAAQFALRRIIEKYSMNARFCFICNYVSKIIPALQSRCTRFKFKLIDFKDSKNLLGEICRKEKLSITDEGLETVFKLSEGDMRRAVNMLQSISISDHGAIKDPEDMPKQIDSNYIYNLSGNINPADMEKILKLLLTQNIQTAVQEIDQIKVLKGVALQVIIKELTILLMKLDAPGSMKGFITQRMADIEYRLSISSNEKIQMASLVSAFVETRHIKEL